MPGPGVQAHEISCFRDSIVDEYAKAINEISQSIKKSDIDLNLDELEVAASLAMAEDQVDSDDDDKDEIDHAGDLLNKLSITSKYK